MKNNFWLFIGITVLLLGGAFLFINWNSIKEKITGTGGTDGNGGTAGGGSSSGGGSTSGGGSGSTGIDYNQVLKKGLYNSAAVGVLQRGLNKVETKNPIKDDEDFGQLTEAKLYSVMGVRQVTLAQFFLRFPWAK